MIIAVIAAALFTGCAEDSKGEYRETALQTESITLSLTEREPEPEELYVPERIDLGFFLPLSINTKSAPTLKRSCARLRNSAEEAQCRAVYTKNAVNNLRS